MRLLVTAVLMFDHFFGYAQQYLTKSPEPSWVADYSYNQVVPDSSGSSDGYAYLLVNVQRHLETKEYYQRYAMKVVSEQGLSQVSSVDISFDPAFQKVLFHTLHIIRNGRTIDKLDISKFELLRREEEMDRAVYDKRLNAIYNLPDIRVGDIIEYSYTVKGTNPVFGDHTFGTWYSEYSVPVGKFAHRLVYDSRRPLRFKAFGNMGAPKETETGNTKTLEWIREDVPALLVDDMLPAWYDPYDHVQFTDYTSWDEIKTWAMPLYEVKETNSKKLRELVQQIRALPMSLEDKIKTCITLVQKDIRYLSFSDGVNGYKPHLPGIVFDQKYGDCKDKSLLLSYLLNAIEIESYPALVSTHSGQTMNDILPDPWAFNHCIVNFTYNDSTFWIDPTLRPQVGPLKSYYLPTYKNALVINSSSGGLEAIPFGYKESRIEVLEEYRMEAVGGEATLHVKSQYYGDEADEIRKYRKNNTKEEIHKNYMNFYARDYSDISLMKSVEFIDDTIKNIVTTSESYLLKNFWVVDSLNKKTTGSTYARILASYIQKPDTELRTMPLRITYPQHIKHTIKIYLPEPWNVQNQTANIEGEGFEYHSSVVYDNRTIVLDYSWQTKAPFIEAGVTSGHIKKVNQVLGDLSYSVFKSYDTERSPAAEYLLTALFVGSGLYFARKTFLRQSRTPKW